MTLQRFASKVIVSGTLLAAFIPVAGLAREHGVNSRGERSSPAVRSSGGNSGQRYSGESRNFAPSRAYGRQAYVAPRGYSGGHGYYGRSYIAPRSYARPAYRGYYSGGVYLGYGAPYGYSYAPGYAYDPGYSYGPAPAPPACTDGAYDQYGNWVPNPNCYAGQPQYQAAPQQNYDSNPQQYPQTQPQQDYDPRYNR